MAFEFRSEKGEEIPRYLAESLGANLFGARGKKTGDDEAMTAADAIANVLLGVGSKAKVTLPFGEVELDRKAKRKLDKEETSDEK